MTNTAHWRCTKLKSTCILAIVRIWCFEDSLFRHANAVEPPWCGRTRVNTVNHSPTLLSTIVEQFKFFVDIKEYMEERG